MNQDIIHVYLMPGMAASSRIFEFISLPEDEFEIHYLDWEVPDPEETLSSYAKKMCGKITHPKSVLLGVSFGGILVQEMSKYLDLKRLLVVSSIKSKHELPKRLALLRVTGAYKILPTRWVKNLEHLAQFSFGETVSKRIELYKKYLTMDDPVYLDWAIKEIIFWDQEEPLNNAIYIHGDKDLIFPHSCEGNCIVIKGGTHIMVINRARWFNENLPRLIKEGK
ncbi:alpha/beta hydrolase [Aegicerativicinus sediminis]|uniref:alpha/beta hydrolase n=1 Tax=Aegicerativicinus sediminis TaxID=2893202 RepID=UPI001E4B609E|nr:alpha/beta hydrolase [Aegicerativicinus sediminis]